MDTDDLRSNPDEKFVLFEIYEGKQKERVGQRALYLKWSEQDVLTELRAHGYPVHGLVRFTGWPSDKKFKIVVSKEGVKTPFYFQAV